MVDLLSTDKTFDTIIIGAGPAGSLCAYELARKGQSVLLLEKERLPRYKVCGGALSRRAEELIPFSITPVVQRRVHEIIFSLDGEHPIFGESEKPFAAMVMRSEFDDFLIKEAKKKGAVLIEGCRVSFFRQTKSGVLVMTENGETIKGNVLIGADGVLSTVRRILGLDREQKRGFALTGEISVPSSSLSAWKDSLHIDIGIQQGGYGWIFPKKTHLSIGLGQFKGKAWGIRETFKDFLSKWDLLKEGTLERARGSFIPVGGKIGDLVHGRILLIGDAGGFTDPLYGEGLYYALKSAHLASKAILNFNHKKSSLCEYQRMVKGEFGPDFRSSLRLFHLFYHFTPVTYQVLKRNPEIVTHLLEMVSGEISHLVFYEHIKGYIPIIKKLVMT